MSLHRETIYSALFAVLKGDPGIAQAFNTVTRRLSRPTQIGSGGMPALSMLEQSEEYHRKLGLPPKVTLSVILRIDSEVQLDSDIPARDINTLCDVVEQAIEPLPGQQVQTLGNPTWIQHAWLDGRVTIYPANVSVRNCLTLMEVKILVGGYP